MQGREVGPYRILSELGSGGMGTVHAAEVIERVAGLEPGLKVAIKFIHPHLLASPGLFERFVREAELGREVIHENVVRTFGVDAVEVDDRVAHYIVMEYVEGRSLCELLRDLGTVPETLLREIALQTAAGLAAIHERGIVHRDLKPENVLISDDQRVRIMDLGVAKLMEATFALTSPGQFVGSLQYASPEQCQGEPVTPASDLYALGVLLYELATGRNPFRHDHPGATIRAHLHHVPASATEANPDLTAFFDELMATLMAKRTGERFGSAKELSTALAEGEDGAWWLHRRKKRRVAELPGIAVRRETSLRGRDAEMGELERTWRSAREGCGAVVLLQGEAGLGKTRLVDAFLRARKPNETHLLYGSFPPSGSLRGLTDAILAKFGTRGLEDALEPYLAGTPRLVPALAALLRGESPPSGAERLSEDALSALFRNLLRALAEERPTVWVLDDLHFAPKEARAVVLAMARALLNRRAMLIVTSRPGLPKTEVAHFTRLEHARHLMLNRLSPREVVELLREALGSEKLLEALGTKIAYKSDGVPFFIFEMIRELAEGGILRRQADGSYVQTRAIEAIRVPSAVRGLIAGRLAQLSVAQRALVDVGAVHGHEFDVDLAAAVLEKPVVQVLQELAEIERRHGIVRSAGRLFRFDHHQIQEVVYEELSPRLREEYHAMLAEAHAARVPDPAGADAHFLAHHHLRGSRPEKGLAQVAAALDHLQERYLNEEALDLADRGLRHALREVRLEVLMRKVRSLDVLGRSEEQRRAAEEALELARDLGDDAGMSGAQHALGKASSTMGRFEEALWRYREALALARRSEDRPHEYRALISLGVALNELGRTEEAIEHFLRTSALAAETGDLRFQASALANLGFGYGGQGRYREALEAYEESLRVGREVHDLRRQAYAVGSVGAVLWHLGRFEESRQRHAEHLALARQIGDRRSEAVARGNLGLALQHVGRLEEARAELETQLEIALEIGAGHIETVCSFNLGLTEYSLGLPEEGLRRIAHAVKLSRKLKMVRYTAHALLAEAVCWEDDDRAEQCAENSLTLFRQVQDRGGEAMALLCRGRVAVRRGETEKAMSILENAAELAREVSLPQVKAHALACRATLPGGDAARAAKVLAAEAQHIGVLTSMDAHFLLWQATRDEAHLKEAHRLLRELRDHAPEDCRDSMIRNVPLHREIMRAWEEQGGD